MIGVGGMSKIAAGVMQHGNPSEGKQKGKKRKRKKNKCPVQTKWKCDDRGGLFKVCSRDLKG